MDNQEPPRDSDPSEMTDFEKNATQEELKRVVPEPQRSRDRREHGNETGIRPEREENVIMPRS